MISLKDLRIVLVGGAGFIGHHLAIKLHNLGANVIMIDGLQVNNLLYYSSTDKVIVNSELYLKIINQRLDLLRKVNIPLYVQDARDYLKFVNIIDEFKPQVLVHLAAVAHADRSNKDPYSTFDHSLRTLENALDSVRESGTHFVYFSSSMVYGNFTSGFVTEDTPCEPIGIYGALKYSGEKMVIAYHQVFDLSYTIVRPSALYGERCVSRRVAQIFIENAVLGQDITIKGDGSDRLDFTYIGDLVNGIINVVQHEDARNQIFNLTYGESRSLADLAALVSEQFPEIKVNYLPKDKLMPDRGTLSVEKARKMIGYQPQFPIEKGIARYVTWYKSLMS